MKVGIIGGSGVYDPNILEDAKQVKVHTPFGKPSDFVTTGILQGREIAILPRHGKGHVYNPTNVNFRANIWALKSLGVTHVIASSAVGSLKEEYKPGDLVFADQFIDRTTQRASTFYEGSQVCHISVAEPFCPHLRTLLIEEAKRQKFPYHDKGTCVVIEGPRFSTKAESNVFRSWGAEIIGMTMHPEATLAREAELCYATIAMVTDYDCWKDTHVSIEEVLATMGQNVEKVKTILMAVIPKIPDERACACKDALKTALL